MSAALVESEIIQPALVAPATLVSAEINQQISTAKAFPRSVTRFRQTITSHATLTKALAQSCLYAMPRAGKVIEGPSVRMAEIISSAWGNCRVGARVVEELDHFVVAQGVFHDLESNAALTIEVQRRITDKHGARFNTDMIGVTGRAACAIARREAIFQGIPRALWWDAYLAAKATVMGDMQTLAHRRKEALAAFKPFGVTDAQIYEALGVAGINDIGLEQLAALGGFITAIRDESRDPEEIFPPAATKAKPPPPPAEEKKNEGAGRVGFAKKTATGPGLKGGSGPASSDEEGGFPLEREIASYLPDAETPGQVEQLREMFAKQIAEASHGLRQRIEKMLDERQAEFTR